MKMNTKLSIAALALFMSLASVTPVNAQENSVSEATTQARTVNKWEKKNGQWFYTIDGVKQTGWVGSDGWYFLDKSGVMQTGWVKVDGSWYYLDANGRMQTGWLAVDGAWYFLNHKGGAMATGWVEVEGLWYFMQHNGGTMLTGWLNLNDTWYFLNHKGGSIVTGWFELDGKKYHFDANGVMATNTTIDGIEIGVDGIAKKVDNRVVLNDAIKEADALLPTVDTDYTEKTAKNFKKVLTDVKAVAKNDKSSDLAILAAIERLETATAELVAIKPDKKDLFAAIEAEETNATIGEQEEYTPESWKVYQETLADAKKVLADENALISQVTAATTAVKAANGKLVKIVVEEEKTALAKAIEAAKALVQSDYTAASLTPFNRALATAEAIAKEAEPATIVVEEAIEALERATERLVANKPTKSILFSAVEDAAKLEEVKYTPESWEAFAKTLAEAKAVLADSKLQSEVDKAVEALDAATKALVVKEGK